MGRGGIRWKIWVAAALALLIAMPIGWTLLRPYQKDRVITFLNPDRDPLGKGYQVTQAKIAIGSGGIHGKGFRQGTQAKLEYLPARHTDFIFSVLGEEWGFIGVTIVLLVSTFPDRAGAELRENARDRGGTFLSICADLVLHLPRAHQRVDADRHPADDRQYSAAADLYGGSSTMMFLIATGLMANVDMRRFGHV
jgi:rod shape determining protein RodA